MSPAETLVATARGELAELRDDLEKLTELAGRVAIATRDGHGVDHQTSVELSAFVASAIDALDSAEHYLEPRGEDGEDGETEVAS